MSWKIDQTLKLQDERLFGDRLVKCFAERPRSVDALLRNAVMRNPAGEAIVDGSNRISYQALDGIVDRIVANLMSLGVVKGDRIALLLRNSAAFIEVVLAAAAYRCDHSADQCSRADAGTRVYTRSFGRKGPGPRA